MYMQRLLAAAVAACTTLACGPASATAIAAVDRSFFSVRPYHGLLPGGAVFQNAPSGIVISLLSHTVTTTISETGLADVTFRTPSLNFSPDGRFSAVIGGAAIANPDGHALGSQTLSVTLGFTNESGIAFRFLEFLTEFSAFNPGGKPIGAQVTDTSLEFARFSTSQTGVGIGDSHACSTDGSGVKQFFAPAPGAACGVDSPDTSSSTSLVISDFGVNDFVTRTFTLSLLLEVTSVPEPGTAATFIIALLGLAAIRRSASEPRR